MSSYVDPKTGKIIYTDGSSTPSEGVYPSSYTGGTSGVSGATGDVAALPTDSYGYAEWLRNSAYQNATDAANKARQDALLNKQNALVGADTAYQQGLATYGANAESLANKGLSNSGYGEYLTGKNYATARAEKAAANATYQGAMNDILYQENSAKQSADQLYAKTMIELKEKDKADAQTAYDALMNSAISGLDLGTLQADARWGSLSPDQTAAITSMVNQKALETRIANGETLDSIMASEEWGGLSTSAQGNLQNAYNVKVRGERYDNVLRDAKAGYYTTETIQQIPNWNEFTEAERNALYDAAREGQENKSNNASTNYGTWLGAINRGEATIDDIRNLAGYSDLSPEQKTSLESASNTYKNNVYTNTKNGIIREMTLENFENYTDAYLDDMIRGGSLDEAGKAAIQETRAEVAFKSAVDSVKDDPSSVLTTAGFEEFHDQIRYLKNNKFISYDEYLQLYNYAREIYDSVREYHNLPEASAAKSGDDIYVYYKGSKFRTQSDNQPLTAAFSETMNSKVTNPVQGDVYRAFGGYYAYLNGSWYDITDDTVRKTYDSILKKPTAPRRGKTN